MQFPRRALLFSVPLASQQFPYPPELPGFAQESYRKADGEELRIWMTGRSDGQSDAAPRPAAVFEVLASKGMTVFLADYRVRSRHKVNISACVADAKAAIRWVRANAKRRYIDQNRMAAGGGSAGGHLAAATATVPGFEDGDNLKFNSKPNALLLFNPALMLASDGSFDQKLPNDISERLGGDPLSLSPFPHLTAAKPPTIIFHGKADALAPYRSIEEYQKKAQSPGAKCILEGYEGQGHGFFHYGRAEYYAKTTARMVEFPQPLGYIH